MLVHHFLETSAQKTPKGKAVWELNQWKTYGQIEAMANRTANFLIEQGFQKGDRVALLYENSSDYIIFYYAILKAGAIVVSINTGYTSEMLAYVLINSEVKAMISQKIFSSKVLPAIQKSPFIKVSIVHQDDLLKFREVGHCDVYSLQTIYEDGSSINPDCSIIDVDIASIVYTSGSTGRPKGVTLTHLNIVSNTKSIVSYLQLTAKDRIMVVLPFYYIYGKSLLNTHFYVGGSVVIDNRFTYPAVILNTMKDTEVTGFAGVPSTFIILINKSPIQEYQFDHLRYVTQAGGAMAIPIQKKVVDLFAPAQLYIMYGATEASARLSYLEPSMLPRKWGSIGKAIPNVELEIVDQTGKPVPPETEGEIAARGANIMTGYWQDPLETQKVLKNGLYYTGDLGKKDKDGYFYVVGRKKDMIKVGGERISPKEIEEQLLEINEIHEVAAIGVPDPVLGEAIQIFIVPRARVNMTENDFLIIIKKKLPIYMHPKTIVITKNLPKNESGKIMKTQLMTS